MAQHCEYTKWHWTSHFKMANFMLRDFYLNKQSHCRLENMFHDLISENLETSNPICGPEGGRDGLSTFSYISRRRHRGPKWANIRFHLSTWNEVQGSPALLRATSGYPPGRTLRASIWLLSESTVPCGGKSIRIAPHSCDFKEQFPSQSASP